MDLPCERRARTVGCGLARQVSVTLHVFRKPRGGWPAGVQGSFRDTVERGQFAILRGRSRAPGVSTSQASCPAASRPGARNVSGGPSRRRAERVGGTFRRRVERIWRRVSPARGTCPAHGTCPAARLAAARNASGAWNVSGGASRRRGERIRARLQSCHPSAPHSGLQPPRHFFSRGTRPPGGRRTSRANHPCQPGRVRASSPAALKGHAMFRG